MSEFGMSISENPRGREVGATTSHSLFRDLNEQLKALNEALSLGIPVQGWICECANHACVEPVELSPSEYEELRRSGRHFFVAPSDEHYWPDVERVTARTDRYWVVETVDRASSRTRRADPGAGDERLRVRT